MIKVENVVTPSPEQWLAVIQGVRNPFNSWEKSDTVYTNSDYDTHAVTIGEKDLALMARLAKAGDDHGKFLRMLPVVMTIVAPHYWWPEMDQYKVGTVTDSCSKMHTLLQKPFELDDFEYNCISKGTLLQTIRNLNFLRDRYINGDLDEYTKKAAWQSILEQLPLGYNQKRTWSGNYQVLKHIYHARKDHKLQEWRDFCDGLKYLPYAKELIIGEDS